MLLHYLPRQYGHFLIPIVQWGTFTATVNGSVTFPITFVNNCYIVSTSGTSAGVQNAGGSAGHFPMYSKNKTTFNYSRWQCGSGNLAGCTWFAIGA